MSGFSLSATSKGDTMVLPRRQSYHHPIDQHHIPPQTPSIMRSPTMPPRSAAVFQHHRHHVMESAMSLPQQIPTLTPLPAAAAAAPLLPSSLPRPTSSLSVTTTFCTATSSRTSIAASSSCSSSSSSSPVHPMAPATLLSPVVLSAQRSKQPPSTAAHSAPLVSGSDINGATFWAQANAHSKDSANQSRRGSQANTENTMAAAAAAAAAATVSASTEATGVDPAGPTPSLEDVAQHCLVFPTYATRHSRSGSKDPRDWNIRVRGWAFSKRSNRRTRLVMSMARKIAGVAKDNKVYETLESRFGMFLASNTTGAQFSLQCVGLASTTHMELAGDSENYDPAVDMLLHGLDTTEGAISEAEVAQEKEYVRKSLEDNREQLLEALERSSNHVHSHGSILGSIPPLEHALVTALKPSFSDHVRRALEMERVEYQRLQETAQSPESREDESDGAITCGDMSAATKDQKLLQSDDSTSSRSEPENRPSGRLGKGAALIKVAIKRCKPAVMIHNSNNSSEDSLRLPPPLHPHQQHQLSVGASSDLSDLSGDEATTRPIASRVLSGDSVQTQSMTCIEDLGFGKSPTVQVSSRPGGHFEGTLRVSHGQVEAYRESNSEGEGNPRFLRLHAHHQDMRRPSHGIVNLIEPEGISVISDIDDTIKETNVLAGARIILRNTFLRDMQEVEGMARVYKNWWNQGAAIHYVSNSPWQLIPSLLEFFHTHMFPPGSAHLRLHDSVLKTYFKTPGENKRRSIQEILSDFPERKFILVGDSGEIDMEIYTAVALKYPDQICKIFIRDITSDRPMKESNNPKTPTTRNRSFTSLLIPKAPLSAVTSGLGGLFSRRGSTASTVGPDNANTSEVEDSNQGISSLPSAPTESLEDEASKQVPQITSTRTARPDLHLGRLEFHGGPLTPKLDPSRPMTPPPLEGEPGSPWLGGSPNGSPRQYGQGRPIMATVRSMTSSVLGSALKRTPKKGSGSNGNSGSAGLSVSYSGRSRSGSITPSSPLVEGNGYPFPTLLPSAVDIPLTKAATSTGLATPIQHPRDVFDDQDSSQVLFQHQQHLYVSTTGDTFTPSLNAVEGRVRTRTTSSGSAASSFTNQSPLLTPVMVPGTKALMMNQGNGMRGAQPSVMTGSPMWGNTTSTTLSNSFTATTTHSSSGPTLSAMTLTTSTSTTTTNTLNLSTSPAHPFATSPSRSPTSPFSISSSKTAQDVWRERVQACESQLPPGILTLFKSADQLEDCQIVKELFRKYSDGGSQRNESEGSEDMNEDGEESDETRETSSGN